MSKEEIITYLNQILNKQLANSPQSIAIEEAINIIKNLKGN